MINECWHQRRGSWLGMLVESRPPKEAKYLHSMLSVDEVSGGSWTYFGQALENWRGSGFIPSLADSHHQHPCHWFGRIHQSEGHPAPRVQGLTFFLNGLSWNQHNSPAATKFFFFLPSVPHWVGWGATQTGRDAKKHVKQHLKYKLAMPF